MSNITIIVVTIIVNVTTIITIITITTITRITAIIISSSLLKAYDHERKVIDKSIAGSETPGKVASQDTADDNVMMIIRTKILLMLKHSQLFKSGHC